MDFMSSHAIVPDSVLFARTTISQSSAGQAPCAVEWNTYTRPSGKLCAAAMPNVAARASAPAANVLIFFISHAPCFRGYTDTTPTVSGDVIDLDQERIARREAPLPVCRLIDVGRAVGTRRPGDRCL